MKKYEIIDHTADIGIRVYGKDLKELFQNAAFGMFDIIADLDGLKCTEEKSITLKAPCQEELLVSWLDELLYHFYTDKLIFCDFDITAINDTALQATVRGRSVQENPNRLKTEIKAVTFHELRIKQDPSGLSVEIIFDV